MSTSTDLNTLGTANASIQGVEAISGAAAAAGVTITLSGQIEGFTITGSGSGDTITGGTGADTISLEGVMIRSTLLMANSPLENRLTVVPGRTLSS